MRSARWVSNSKASAQAEERPDQQGSGDELCYCLDDRQHSIVDSKDPDPRRFRLRRGPGQ
jgi:hypothetical protein